MGATFVIVLREAFEAALLLGILYTYLQKIGARQHAWRVTLGALLGLVASACLGAAVTWFSGPLLDVGPDVVAAGVLFAAVILLTWHAWWMQQHAREIKGSVVRQLDEACRAQRMWIVGLIAFTAVFREGSETVLFLWGLMTQVAMAGGAGALVGGMMGLALAAFLGWVVYRGSTRVNLRTFFNVTTVVLWLFAAGMFSAGIGRLQGLGFLPFTQPLWDTSSVLSERSFVGSLLCGLVGYRAQPTAAEVIAYAIYLVVAGRLLFGRPLRKPWASRVSKKQRAADVSDTSLMASTVRPCGERTP